MSLAKKLLIKSGHRVLVLRAPQAITELLVLPEGASITSSNTARGTFDVVLIFVSSAKGLTDHAPKALTTLSPGGVLWFAYPKKTSGVSSDLSRDEGWAPLRTRGWGPVAQVAIDATWSAVRFKPEAEIDRQPRETAAPKAQSGAGKRVLVDLVVPDELSDGLRLDKAASATWKALSPPNKREYVSWITEAKKPETRSRRIARALELLAAGVHDRNTKYRSTDGA